MRDPRVSARGSGLAGAFLRLTRSPAGSTAAAGSSRSGSGGGVPPYAGQRDWWAHQSHIRLGLARQSPVDSARRIASQMATTLRSVASRSASSGT